MIEKVNWSTAIGLVGIIVVLFVIMLVEGGCQPIQPYQYIQSPGGQQMVVIHDGGNDFLVDALIFSQLGYTGCVNHYHMYPGSYARYDRRSYSNWSNVPPRNYQQSPPRGNSYQRTGQQSTPVIRNTTPPSNPIPRTSSYQRSSNFSAPSRPVIRNTSPSYSSPSRTSSYSRSSRH